MPNQSADILFQLIRSMEKSEKRNFKLYIQRNSVNKDLKIIQLFDAIDKLSEYDEGALLKKLSSIEKPQLSNLKTHLYKQILASLRVIKSADGIELMLNEQFDFARILYNKGLYHQALKILERVKEISFDNHQLSFLSQAISFEKKIEALYITRSLQNRSEQLTFQSLNVNQQRTTITKLSNLALQMYSWYVKNGHARNKEEEAEVKNFFYSALPNEYLNKTGFYERLYIYQAFCWYAYIRQDFLMYYRYTQKWVELFSEFPNMIPVEAMHFIKGMHNLMNALFDLRHHKKFSQTLLMFENHFESKVIQQHQNTRIQAFIYLTNARLNKHIIAGEFEQAQTYLPEIEKKLTEYKIYIDVHRILVINYKTAMIYFGSADYNTCIDYLHKIIHHPVDLREDLQCYARLLHLIAHYELGNLDIIDYLTKSVYRFMAKMKRYSIIEEEMIKFLRKSFHTDKKELKIQFKLLLEKLRQFEKKQFETRTFAYLDIISWLESKVDQIPMEQIIKQKYLNSRR